MRRHRGVRAAASPATAAPSCRAAGSLGALLLLCCCANNNGGSAQAALLAQNLRTFPLRDNATFWPLCGRIHTGAGAGVAPPAAWNGSACPAQRRGLGATDLPIRSTFGPRPLSSDGERFDWHRGIDISTPVGTAAFAIADGIVTKVGVDSSYSEEVLIVRHFRGAWGSCAGGNCFHAVYLHMSDDCCPGLSVDDEVVAGQFVGFTGASASGYAHLHFEIRDSPPDDVYSSWQRDCVHPLHALPYECDAAAAGSHITVTALSDDVVNVTARFTDCDNVVGISLSLRDADGVTLTPLPQDTPDAAGYLVNQSSIDFDTETFFYSHKDSSSVPWEDFDEGGAYPCPYAAAHGGSYSAHVHLDNADPADPRVGLFNGRRIVLREYAVYSPGSSGVDETDGEYEISVEWRHLGPRLAAADCARATVHFAGVSSEWLCRPDGMFNGAGGSGTAFGVALGAVTAAWALARSA